MNKKYIVRLTDEERAICEATIKKETGKSEKLRRATILLKADADGPAWNDAKISEAVGCRTRTVENVRQAFVLEGFEAALVRKKRATPPTPKLLDGAGRGEIDRPAVGQAARRLRPLDAATAGRSNGGTGDRGIDQPGDGPSDAKKNGMTKRKIEYWVIPPDADGEFVANMEEVLETYEKAYDPDCPVVCMDEQPVQLIGETRVPIPATKEHPERVDYEYERKGTASIFMFAEPLSGFRQATARPRRTKDDWAHEVAHLLDTRYAGVERITLVCDNLNTHTKGAFYEAFPPDKARDYVRRIDFVYTPKHGSWLNVAECELSCMTSQCLTDRRIGDLETLQSEIAAWSTRVNKKQRAVDWQFTIDKARVKLKRLYPKI